MNLADVFSNLQKIMIPYAEKLECTVDQDDELSIYTKHILDNGKPLWFGGVQIKKNYVSYHPILIWDGWGFKFKKELLEEI